MGQTRLSHAGRLAIAARLLLLAVLACPAHAYAGHDQPTDDLVYFLPMAADRAKRLLDVGEKITFIDLRSAAEYKEQRLPGARSIPLKELDKRHGEIPKTGRVILYCGCPPGNVEEGYAYQLLRDLGYRNISVLEGGFAEWRKRGYPVESDARR